MSKNDTNATRASVGRPRIDDPSKKRIAKSVTLTAATWNKIDATVKQELAFNTEPEFNSKSRYIENVVMKDLLKRNGDSQIMATASDMMLSPAYSDTKSNAIDPDLMRREALAIEQKTSKKDSPDNQSSDDDFFDF